MERDRRLSTSPGSNHAGGAALLAASRLAAPLVAWTAIAAAIAIVLAPWFRDTSTFGFHDWDSQTAHRYLVRLSLLRYREFPWWNPFACGGFPAWGYVEGDTTLAAPWLPLYLGLPMSLALRLEVAGMAVIGALGAYLFAGCFTRSYGARALVVVLWAVNGRWALQTAAGHTWHLAYAWLPWCLFFYERARTRPLLGAIGIYAGAAGCIAMLVYSGGIYPLPHTVLALVLYAGCLSILERSTRPLVALAICGALGIGLAAPKLLPIVEGFRKVPRLVDSPETLTPAALWTLLTSPDQSFSSRPARVSHWGWHEWGMYVSLPGALVLAAAFAVRGRRETALKITAAAFVALGFGSLHPYAPWTLVHAHVPVFRSQHVPSRFLYPAVLLLAVIAASALGRFVERRRARAALFDALLASLVLGLGIDVAKIAEKPMAQAMWMVPPKNIPTGRPFHFEKNPPLQYVRPDWAGPMYLAMLANTGVLNCYGTPPFDRRGALAASDPRYRGEVHVEGGGTAALVSWSPSRAVVDVADATDGATLVYNMNFDEGWRAKVEAPGGHARSFAAASSANAVAVDVPPGASRVTLTYRPETASVGFAIGALTAALIAALWVRELRGGLAC